MTYDLEEGRPTFAHTAYHMAAKSLLIEQESVHVANVARNSRMLSAWEAAIPTKLLSWYGSEFGLFDGATGEPLNPQAELSDCNWYVRGQLCRAVASRGFVEIIEEAEPLVLLAIPIASEPSSIVAVAVFATSSLATTPQVARAGELLGLEPAEAARWIARQSYWRPETLISVGQLAAEKLAAEQRLSAMEQEARDLSAHLSTTYEEISLLYRLTQNLKLSSNDEALGAMALEWLSEVLPVEALAIQLAPSQRAGSTKHDARSKPVLLTYGACPIDGDQLTEIIEYFDLQPGQRPLVVNQIATSADTWRWPAVQELIIVSLCEGANCFGWLAAFNRTQTHELGRQVPHGEFGTVEASLLSSVAAILGIHSGNAELYYQQREFFAGVVRALTAAIDAKDPYTCGHSDRVSRVAVRLAEELGLDHKQVETIYLSGLLHDVGKIGIDDNVLRKPGKLTEAEYEHIKTHSEIGYRILSDIKQLDEVLPVVLHHHEQWDGGGYPHGLLGEEIPILARIVAVADSFDAMSSDRPYRQGMDDTKLDAILRDGAGKQWDAAVVDAFFRARDEIRRIATQKVKSLNLKLHDRT